MSKRYIPRSEANQILEQLKKGTLTQIKKQINIVGAPRQLTDRQKIERNGDRNSFFKKLCRWVNSKKTGFGACTGRRIAKVEGLQNYLFFFF